MIAQAWMAAARARRRLYRLRGARAPREDLVARHVRGRSFLDVGCMWSVDGAIAFGAEAAGASRVTAIDVMAPTQAYLAEHARRDSQVTFWQGDIHDPALIARAGVHDVVWCSGVVYHAPHPLLTLQRLRELTGQFLLLASETIPEVPGLAQACVYLPGLGEADRRAHGAGRGGGLVGVDGRFDPGRGYANWFWGLSPSALRAMVASAGFEVLETRGPPLHTTSGARPVARAEP